MTASGQASFGNRIIERKLFLGHTLTFRISLRLVRRVFPRLARRRQRLQRRRPVRLGHVGFRITEIIDLHIVDGTGPVFRRLRELERQPDKHRTNV